MLQVFPSNVISVYFRILLDDIVKMMCNDANLIDSRSSRLWLIEGAAQRQYKANRLLLARLSLKLASAACVLVVSVGKKVKSADSKVT